MKLRSLLACTVFVLAGIQAYGQEDGGLTLSRLWEHALANYPGLDAYRSQQRQADVNERLMRNQYLPDVYLQAQNSLGTQNAVSGAFFPLPGLYNVNGSQSGSAPGLAGNVFGSVLLEWKFFQFGKHRKSLEAAEIASSQATQRLKVEQLSILAEVTRTYLRLSYHLGMEAWAKKNRERLQTILEASASMVSAGLSPGADSLLIKASLNQTSAELSLWQGNRAETRIELSSWLNVPANQLVLKDVSILREDMHKEFFVGEKQQMHHPLLALGEEQVAYVEKQEALASVSALPSLSLLSGAQVRGNSMNAGNSFYENIGHSYNSPAYNYAVGVGITWNVGNAFDSRLERKRYSEERRQREAETDETALRLRSQEERARMQIAQGQEQINAAEHAYQSAKEAYALFETRYSSGLISITELLQIQDVLQKTEKTRIDAYYQYWLHHVNLAQSTADFTYLQKVFE